MSSVLKEVICDCPCHKVSGILHIVACCYTCPACKKERLKYGHTCPKPVPKTPEAG